MSKFFYLVILLMSNFHLFAQNNLLEIKILAANYNLSRNQVVLKLSIKNNSSDSLHLLKPYGSVFKQKYAKSPQIVNYSGLPFDLKVYSEACNQEMEKKFRGFTKKIYPGKTDELSIPPGERLLLEEVSIKLWNTPICMESKPQVQVVYQGLPQPISLNKERRLMESVEEIEKIVQEINNELTDTEAFFEVELRDLKDLRWFIRSGQFARKVLPIKVESNTVPLLAIE